MTDPQKEIERLRKHNAYLQGRINKLWAQVKELEKLSASQAEALDMMDREKS